MKARDAIWLPVLATLGGCGGGGSGTTVGSTPAPPSYTALANATASTPLSTQAARYEYIRLNNASTPTLKAQLASIEVSYDSASGVYRVRGAPSSGSTATVDQSFGPSDATVNAPALYEKTTSANGVTSAGRLNAGPLSGFTYASFGSWTTGSSDATNQGFTTFYFSYGIRTQPDDMPKTGSASYAVQLSGGDSVPVGGTGTITANFASGTIGASLDPTFIYGPNRISNFASLSGTGTINAASSSFTASVTGGGYSASLNGLFYGPQAAELGGAFTLTGPGGNINAAGAFVGRRN